MLWQWDADIVRKPTMSDCFPSPQVAQRVPEEMLGSGELIEIVADMIDVMREAPGVGLAAPQIGIPLQARRPLALVPSQPVRAAEHRRSPLGEPRRVSTTSATGGRHANSSWMRRAKWTPQHASAPSKAHADI